MEVGKINPMADLPAVAAVPTLTPQERSEQQQLIHAVQTVNGAQLFGQGNELTFHFDRHTKKPVLRIVDKETHEVLRQIPPEYVLRLSEDLSGK